MKNRITGKTHTKSESRGDEYDSEEYPVETEQYVGNLCRETSTLSSSTVRDKVTTFFHSAYRCVSVDKIKTLIPVLQWLPEYNWKAYLYEDIIAGLTIVALLIPQSAAFSALAGVPTSLGMYTSSISAFVCFIFSLSRHGNVGPISIVSLMVAESAEKVAKHVTGLSEEDAYLYAVLTLPFTCGILLILVSLFRFGNVVSTMLSDPVMSAVICAGALLVLTSQIGGLLGMNVPRHSQPFQFFYSWEYILSHLNEIHWQTAVVGVSTMVFVLLVQAVNNKFESSFPIPVELLAVVVFTALSVLINEKNMGVKVVGEISSSLPKPTLPSFNNGATFGDFAQESIGLVVVISVMGLSVAKTFSKKFDYYINPDQEVFAYGMCNLIGAFFMCYPPTVSLSRSAVLAAVGCNSQLYLLLSGSLILLVITKLSYLMEELPYTCLSAIVLVSLKEPLKQHTTRPKELWDMHREDSILWLISFIFTLSLGMQWGTISSMIFNASLIVWRVSTPKLVVLGLLEGTEVYRNSEKYSNLKLFPGILALRIDVGELSHLNRKQFEESAKAHVMTMMEDLVSKQPCFVILDITAVAHIDTSSLSNLQDINTWLKDRGIKLLIVGSKYPVRDAMVGFGLTDAIDFRSFFPRMHSAVEYALSKQQDDIGAECKEELDNTEGEA